MSKFKNVFKLPNPNDFMLQYSSTYINQKGNHYEYLYSYSNYYYEQAIYVPTGIASVGIEGLSIVVKYE